MNIRTSAVCLLASLIATCAAAAQAQRNDRSVPPGIERVDSAVRDIRICTRPFERRGTVQLRPGFSGSVGVLETPGSAFLRVDSVRTSLRAPGLHASALGVTTQGRFAWHTMTVADAAGRFPADTGPRAVYADGGGLVRIEINRLGSTAAPATGDYVLRGCLVDGVPPRLDRYHVDPPRLPPNILLPGEALRRQPGTRDGGG